MGRLNPKLTTSTKQWETSTTTHTYAASAIRARGAHVDTQFRDTFRTSPIQPSSTFLWTRFMYYILFILLSMAQAHVTIWGKLRKCGLEGMGRFLSDLLHEPNPCVLPSGQGTLVAPQAHGGGLVSKISTPK